VSEMAHNEDDPSYMKRRAIPLLLAAATLMPAAAPGTPTRRLSGYEYNCTVRDLLGVDFHADFDDNADSLTIAPALLAKYLAAAKKIARAAVDPVPPPSTPELARHVNASALSDITWERKFTWDGDYDVHVALAGRKGNFALYISADDEEPQRLPVSVNFEGRRYADTRLNLSAGSHRLRLFVAGGNDGAAEKAYPEFLEVRGPYGPVFPAIPAGYKLVFACGHAPGHHTSACVHTDLEDLARRAWRRPVTSTEIARLMKLVSSDPSATPEQQTEIGLEAILVSPSFLFRVEHGSDFDLASRLSYFLWSSMPDAELFRAASQGKLADPAVLATQTRRMLADPKSRALAENFAAQWLEFRNLDFAHRDPARFPQFTEELRDSMRRETELFFEHVNHDDRSVLDFVNGKYSFVNELLARLYGISGVTGDRFRQVDLAGTGRTGILTQASVLTVTSYATRTSPVLRGKWILENILNDPPPPPPANVPALRDPASEPALTLRQQLEQHRSNPACASCHSRMDTLGFGLENFDAIGRWRTHDEALPVDSSGTLPDGSSFSSTVELAAILVQRPNVFAQCLTEKLMAFALGRELGKEDHAVAARISESAAGHDYRFSDLILGIVNSQAFRASGGTHD
jgi:hypothetical protein